MVKQIYILFVLHEKSLHVGWVFIFSSSFFFCMIIFLLVFFVFIISTALYVFLCFIFCICVPVLEHCVLCVYTFRPLSIPRPSPSDVSPNKLQNVKSRLNFHSIFQLASHQRGLSAQPTPNLLLTSIGFLMKIERHTYKMKIYTHRLDNRENGIFSGFA